MDLSIENINKVKKQPSFQGLKGTFSPDSTFSLKFIAPPYDRTKERVVLEFVPLEKDEETDSFKKADLSKKYAVDFNADDTVELDEDMVDIDQDGMKSECDAFGYRFKIINNTTGAVRYVLDPFKTVGIEGSDDKMNIIDQGRKYGITPKGGSMYHAFIDSNVVLDKSGKPKNVDPKLVRNHFNKYGGSIKGLNWLLKNTNELEPYRYVMSTPDIGADPTSSHKYWPNNQFQCSNLDDFKEFNRELFKEGKGYVADGAFTSQSLQSPMLQHALKWGKESPFYTMLKINGDVALGVLPNFSDAEGRIANEHVGVKLVNNPFAEGYDKNKPSYLQFFDDRLSSKEQRKENALIKAYDSYPDDHYEITSHQDSVQPFYFEIQPYDNRIKEFFSKDNNVVYLRDLFGKTDKTGKKDKIDELLAFENYRITDKQHTSGVTNWDGNVDIVKMNLSRPMNDDEVTGMLNAREYLHKAASYWTETVQSDLILTAAQTPDKARLAKVNDLDLSKIDFDAIESPVLQQNKKAEDYIKEFPLQSIEVSPELSIIFAEPDFNSKLLSDGVKEKLRSAVNEVIDAAVPQSVPEEQKPEYKAYLLKTSANTVIKGLLVSAITNSVNGDAKDAPKALKEDGTINYDELRKVTLKSLQGYNPTTVADEQKQVYSRIKSNILNADRMKAPKAAMINYLKQQTNGVSLEDFKTGEAIVLQGRCGLNWRFDAAKDIGDLDSIRNGKESFNDIWNGKGKDPGVQSFWAEFVDRIHQYNPSSYIINEITCLNELVDQEGATVDKIKTYDMKNYKHIMDFDKRLGKGLIQKIINHAKTELVKSLGEIEKKKSELSTAPADKKGDIEKAIKGQQERRDKIATQIQVLESSKTSVDDKSEALRNLDSLGAFFGVWEEHMPYAKEMQFLERTNSTTDSNYGALFNKLSEFAGTNPEHVDMEDNPGNVFQLKEKVDKFIQYAQPNTAMLSHVFIDNHDKPRALHTFPLDMPLFYSDNPREELERNCNADLKFFVKDREDYQNISTKALAVGRLFKKHIDNGNFTPEEKESLSKSLKNLVNGQKDDQSKPSLKRATSFAVLPYEITVRDMFKGAGFDVDSDEVKDKMLEFHSGIMRSPMELQERLWQVMGSLIGVNTLFNGTEFAQTGYETRNKNVYVTNRNPILHDLKDDEKHGYKPYFDKMQAISGLYKTEGMSAVKEGTPISCDVMKITSIPVKDDVLDGTAGLDFGKYKYFRDKTQAYIDKTGETLDDVLNHVEKIKNDEKALHDFLWEKVGVHPDGGNHAAYISSTYMDALRQYGMSVDENVYAWPLYKYDEFGSKTLSLITNNGMPKKSRSNKGNATLDRIRVNAIPLKAKDGCPLPEGTELYRKVYNPVSKKYETEQDRTYIVKKEMLDLDGKGAKEFDVLKAKDNNDIIIADTVENFYVPSEEEKRRRAQAKFQRS